MLTRTCNPRITTWAGRLNQEDDEVKVSLGYIPSWRPAWATRDYVSEDYKRRGLPG